MVEALFSVWVVLLVVLLLSQVLLWQGARHDRWGSERQIEKRLTFQATVYCRDQPLASITPMPFDWVLPARWPRTTWRHRRATSSQHRWHLVVFFSLNRSAVDPMFVYAQWLFATDGGDAAEQLAGRYLLGEPTGQQQGYREGVTVHSYADPDSLLVVVGSKPSRR